MPSIRPPRQAQIDGLTKWIVFTPAAFSRVSTPRLKSGASTPMKASGLSASRRSTRLLPDRQDLAEVAEHLEVAAHRELVVRPPGDEAVLGHARARRCPRRRAAASAREAREQRAGEQVARGLARDHREPGSVGIHPRGSRLSERCRAWPRRGSRRPGGRRRPLPASPRRARRSWRGRRRRSGHLDTAGDASA